MNKNQTAVMLVEAIEEATLRGLTVRFANEIESESEMTLSISDDGDHIHLDRTSKDWPKIAANWVLQRMDMYDRRGQSHD